MVKNPLLENPEREHRVRERAYHLWEAEGKPHGRDVEFWERARELIAIEESAGAAQLPNPQNHTDTPRETGVEEAEIQENLGEFPDRLADQGEWQPTPAPAHAHRQPTAAASPKPAAAASAAASPQPAPASAKPAAAAGPKAAAARTPKATTSPKVAASPKAAAAATRKPATRSKKPKDA